MDTVVKKRVRTCGGGYNSCIVPNLPTPQNQNYKTWSSIIDGIPIDENDVIVAWSTGAIFIVRYLFEKNIKISKLILISGFNNYIGNVPFVDNINKDFFMADVGIAKDVAKKIICIKSNNDPFITQRALNDFATKLNAQLINIDNGGHFNCNAGYNSFALLKELIQTNYDFYKN